MSDREQRDYENRAYWRGRELQQCRYCGEYDDPTVFVLVSAAPERFEHLGCRAKTEEE